MLNVSIIRTDQIHSTESMFAVGKKCLAYHGPMLYEANILRAWDPEMRTVTLTVNGQLKTLSQPEYGEEFDAVPASIENEPCYFVHYQGWKATWDEWIGLDRINEYNEENIKLKTELTEQARRAKKQKQQEQQRKKKGSSVSNASIESVNGNSGSGTGLGNNKKGKHDSGNTATKKSSGSNIGSNAIAGDERRMQSNGTGSAGATSNVSRIVLRMPVRLKSLLVDDWEFVTKNKKICQLPSPTMTVDQVIASYESARSDELESPALQSQLTEYCSGLNLYFEHSLPVLLLYRFERLQYDEILKKEKFQNKLLASIYGPIHLLRLLSILPELMSTTTMDSQSCQLIVQQTENFLDWLVVHIDQLFDTSSKMEYYVNTSSQYEGVALGM
ncbi:hypothetical protein HG535_0B03340 [Zygotorulaspora mrakii]|uniref:Chromatin modification-related protein EAF3 n=1 Tax=Zygotorulaspora mrakii TaxID=42260 RepID=A0A7H9AY25_ZYGMR|nr:uncharacterized protein HG535_0B03340 [Zygotorulaspora mrakii]QLG71295.1 hypothetical protein HG535_0B03340 [Zygotorulaspora mrakii]